MRRAPWFTILVLMLSTNAAARQPHMIGARSTALNTFGNTSMSAPTTATNTAIKALTNNFTVMVARIHASDGSPVTVTTPSGWTLDLDCSNGGTLATYNETWIYHRVFQTGDTSWTWNVSSTSPWTSGIIEAWDDANTTTPIESATSGNNCTSSSSAAASATTKSVTPTSADGTLLLDWMSSASSNPNDPQGAILLGTAESTVPWFFDNPGDIFMDRFQNAPTTTSASATYTETFGTSKPYVTTAVVLDPANSGTADVPEIEVGDFNTCGVFRSITGNQAGWPTCDLSKLTLNTNDLLVITNAAALNVCSVNTPAGFTAIANGSGASGGLYYQTWTSGSSVSFTSTCATGYLVAITFNQSSNGGKAVIDTSGTGTVAAASSGLASSNLTAAKSLESYFVHWHDSQTHDGPYTAPALLQMFQPNASGQTTCLGMSQLMQSAGATGTFTASIAADSNPLNQESILVGFAAVATIAKGCVQSHPNLNQGVGPRCH